MSRHVECQDCHNPHASTQLEASAPFAGGSLAWVGGVTAEGVITPNARFEYEVCFRCHSNDTSTAMARHVFQPDKRLQFDASNPSYHPVTGPGQGRNVPSLLSGFTGTSYIYCTDCHANDQGVAANAPRGPHGSSWPLLLERQYEMFDGVPEDSQRYALCYKCHNRTSIMSDESFPLHAKHVRDYRTSCATCHDPAWGQLHAGKPLEPHAPDQLHRRRSRAELEGRALLRGPRGLRGLVLSNVSQLRAHRRPLPAVTRDQEREVVGHVRS